MPWKTGTRPQRTELCEQVTHGDITLRSVVEEMFHDNLFYAAQTETEVSVSGFQHALRCVAGSQGFVPLQNNFTPTNPLCGDR